MLTSQVVSMGVVDWFGSIDFLKMQEQFAGTGCKSNTNEARSPVSKLISAAIQTVPDKVAQANPKNYITADDMPIFIENVITECNIPPIQNKKTGGCPECSNRCGQSDLRIARRGWSRR